jgi:hypothetical protein
MQESKLRRHYFPSGSDRKMPDHFASRIPENCQRVSGAKKLR